MRSVYFKLKQSGLVALLVAAQVVSPELMARARKTQTAQVRPREFANAKLADWLVMPPRKVQMPGGLIESREIQRIVKVGPATVPAANISLLKFHDTTGKFTPDEVASHIQRVARIKSAAKTRIGDVYTYDTNHDVTNRYIRMMVRQKGSTFFVSIASIRRMYVLPVLFEAEIVQRNFVGLPKNVTAKNSSLWDLFVSKSYALGEQIESVLADKLRTVNVGKLEQVAQQLGGSASGALNQVGTFATNLSGQIDSGLATAKSAVATVQDGVGAVKGLSTSIDGATAQVKDSTKVMQQMASPKSLAMSTAVVTGTALAVTGVFALGIPAATYAAEELYRFATGTLNSDERLRRGTAAGDALAAVAAQAEVLAKLEKQIDLYVNAAAYAASTASKANSLSGVKLAQYATGEALGYKQRSKILLDRQANRALGVAEGAEDAFFTSPREVDCTINAGKFEKLSADVTEYAQIMLQAGNGSVAESMCFELNRMFETWVEAELKLQAAQKTLIANAGIYVGEATQQLANIGGVSGRRERNTCQEADGTRRSEAESRRPRGCARVNVKSKAPHETNLDLDCYASNLELDGLDDMYKQCEQYIDYMRGGSSQQGRDYVARRANQLANAQYTSVLNRVKDMTKADCSQEQSKLCMHFKAVADSFRQRLANAKHVCGGMMRGLPVFEEAARDPMPGAGLTQVAAKAPPTSQPEESFLSSFFSDVGDFFEGLFSWV